MQISNDLSKGLEIIEPFLKQHDFKFKKHEEFKGSNSHFLLTKYKKDRKEFILGYHCSIGQVVYQFENISLSHDFYLDKLGFANKIQFIDKQTNDKILAFENLLYDFNFLVEDFFVGKCTKLKEFSRLKENIFNEYDKKNREGKNREFDKLKIEKAREEFRIKNFKNSLEIYMTIEFKDLMSELDERIIEFCHRHIQ